MHTDKENYCFITDVSYIHNHPLLDLSETSQKKLNCFVETLICQSQRNRHKYTISNKYIYFHLHKNNLCYFYWREWRLYSSLRCCSYMDCDWAKWANENKHGAKHIHIKCWVLTWLHTSNWSSLVNSQASDYFVFSICFFMTMLVNWCCSEYNVIKSQRSNKEQISETVESFFGSRHRLSTWQPS